MRQSSRHPERPAGKPSGSRSSSVQPNNNHNHSACPSDDRSRRERSVEPHLNSISARRQSYHEGATLSRSSTGGLGHSEPQVYRELSNAPHMSHNNSVNRPNNVPYATFNHDSKKYNVYPLDNAMGLQSLPSNAASIRSMPYRLGTNISETAINHMASMATSNNDNSWCSLNLLGMGGNAPATQDGSTGGTTSKRGTITVNGTPSSQDWVKFVGELRDDDAVLLLDLLNARVLHSRSPAVVSSRKQPPPVPSSETPSISKPPPQMKPQPKPPLKGVTPDELWGEENEEEGWGFCAGCCQGTVDEVEKTLDQPSSCLTTARDTNDGSNQSSGWGLGCGGPRAPPSSQPMVASQSIDPQSVQWQQQIVQQVIQQQILAYQQYQKSLQQQMQPPQQPMQQQQPQQPPPMQQPPPHMQPDEISQWVQRSVNEYVNRYVPAVQQMHERGNGGSVQVKTNQLPQDLAMQTLNNLAMKPEGSYSNERMEKARRNSQDNMGNEEVMHTQFLVQEDEYQR